MPVLLPRQLPLNADDPRDPGTCNRPGGRREVLEETGIKIALPATLTGVYKNMSGLIVSLVFRCEAIDGDVSTGPETSAVRWATREEVSDLADEAYAVRVLDALDTVSPPVVRAHDGVKLV
ncbi:NUDIX hydrolase [Streptomyces sp. NPDC021224]|uniref:NUDIX hydrolase n=1 Tax=unclassified Streptomyces TaxID=2593676 RepID=UPI00378AE462